MSMPPTRPAILVSRAVFPEVVQRLREHFEVETNEADTVWPSAELAKRLQGKQGAFITGGDRIDAALLAANPQLKAVCSMAVGYNNIDVAACTAAGVLCSNTPDVLTETTADFGFALMMAAARRLSEGERLLRRGEWAKWSYDMLAGGDVHGATLGILGMGRIGQAIARRGALGFGMPVIYHNRSRLDAAVEAELKARYVSKEELLRQADHLVLVLPYSPASHHAVGAAELALMKPTATLTNIARGGIVDEAALAAALTSGHLGGAAVDVYSTEPPGADNPLLKLSDEAQSRLLLTPHIAGITRQSWTSLFRTAWQNMERVLVQKQEAQYRVY
jgi:gluconate 2-dehydrogenase